MDRVHVREGLSMTRALWFGLLVLAGPFAQARLGAQEFTINLEVRSGKAVKAAHAEPAEPGERPRPRGVLEVKAGAPVTVKWTLGNAGKAAANNVLVHFFAVKEEKAGQAPPPKLSKDVVAESALTMDFNPKDTTEGELTFSVATAGPYLLRLETIGAGAGREVFAAIDLVVR
jgi:hypothetical protein